MSRLPCEEITLEQFQSMAEEQLGLLPAHFRDALQNVVIVVERQAGEEQLAALDLDAPDELLGLYQGEPLPSRGSGYSGQLPDVIHLYMDAIIQYSRQGNKLLPEAIREVLMHEIGHHFGLSDADMTDVPGD
ncbi:MAG: metallopeptidase family protein [Zetaproteobacteria bacterium]|nr:MAG: metallopeptidase family protein [Zetaproteobacteria bacterium]